MVADKGYYNGEEIRECELSDITAYVAKPRTSPNKAKGQFDRSVASGTSRTMTSTSARPGND